MVQTWTLKAGPADLARGRGATFSTPAALEALLKLLYVPLTVDKRTGKQEDIVELVLLIIRNLVHCPNRKEGNTTTDSLQDKAILACETVGILDLIVSLANDVEANDIFAGLLMEIVIYLLRDQTPEGLINAGGACPFAWRCAPCLRGGRSRSIKPTGTRHAFRFRRAALSFVVCTCSLWRHRKRRRCNA